MADSVRYCTDPEEDARKAEADEASAVVPEATVTFEYEVKWTFRPRESNCWVEEEILVKMSH